MNATKAFVLGLILLMAMQCFAKPAEDSGLATNGPLHDTNKASTLLGLQVSNHSGEKLGKLADLVIDLPSSQLVYAVVAVGGFIGIGEKYIALPPNVLSVARDGRSLLLDADKEALRHAPGFAASNAADLTNQSAVASVYDFYGKKFPRPPGETNFAQLAANQPHKAGQIDREINEAAGSENPKKDLNFFKVTELIGMTVVGGNTRRVAGIRDLAVDLKTQQALYVVLSSGGFLGTGERLYAVPCFAFSQTGDAKLLSFNLPIETFNQATAFQPRQWPTHYDEAFSVPVRSATTGSRKISEPAGVPRERTNAEVKQFPGESTPGEKEVE